MTVKLSMADMVKEPEMPRTTFPYPSAGRPAFRSSLDNYDETHPQWAEDEDRGTFMGMTESEFLGDVGDK